MVTQYYDTHEEVLHVDINGELTLTDMFEAMQILLHDQNLPKNLKILENPTKANIQFNAKDLSLIADKMKQSLKNFNTVKHAVIQAKPMGTAFVIMITDMIKVKGYSLEVFSTEKSARKWLNLKQQP